MRTSQTIKYDITHLTILLSVAFCIGVYLIVTTVLVARDGVFYIEQAQKFQGEPIGVIKGPPFGYPFLIFAAHKFVCFFSNNSSIYSWIYSAQSVTLLCRLLALIPLYFTGKLLIGGRKSFWAVLVLVILPYPARFGSDALRDWPHILFLATGFLLLLWGCKYGKWWAFGLVGLNAGLGYLIRPMCAQLVLYGFIWLVLNVFWSKRNMTKLKLLAAMVSLLVGFAMPAGPYMKLKGQIFPYKYKVANSAPVISAIANEPVGGQPLSFFVDNHYLTGITFRNVMKAFGELAETIGENLMWFFVPALCIGFYYRFRQEAKHEERILITSFVLMNAALVLLRYCCVAPDISRRYSLPLISFTIFYIPVGLHAIGNWLGGKFPMSKQREEKRFSWFLVLLLIGICICIPKLLRPVRIEKQGYKEAANWLRGNTAAEDVIAVPDKRISFYAERKGLGYGKKVPKQAKYIVRIVKDEDEKPEFGTSVQEKYSVWIDKREKKKRIVIYEVL